jgi:nuclear GTP-binding protein
MKLLEVESFQDTFGPKKQRKRPKVGVADVNELATTTDTKAVNYVPEKDRNIKVVKGIIL